MKSLAFFLTLALSGCPFAPSVAQVPAPVGLTSATSLVRGSLPLRNDIAIELHGLLLEDPKIVGGLFTKPGDDPWQVALIRATRAGPDLRPFCGGSMLSSIWVVTAAHCVDNGTLPTDIDILAGTTDVGVGGMRVRVVEIVVHPAYVPGTIPRNDIALLRTAAPLIGSQIAAISVLAPASASAALQGGAATRVTGWGSIGQGGEPVRDLRFVDLRVITNTDCNDRVAYKKRVGDEMLCAGILGGGKDSCQGDSGGPLTMIHGGRRQLAGIVSWGEGCAQPNRPGVYTRVSMFATWLEDCQAQRPACKSPVHGG